MIETVDDIKTIANVGTGTMGHAITLQFALAGYPVHLVGRGEASLEKAMKAIRSDAEDFAEAGLLKDGDTLDAVLARITGYADYASGVADVDFVIESVAENLDIKKSVWAEVEHAAPKDAILSTNTSGLSPTALQSVLKKPERFVVAHFWNPAQLMPLVEVVPGEKTDPKVVDITFDLMAKIGKKPAKIKKESLGFVGNRLQLAVLREAFYIVQQGIADAATVDDVMKYSLGLAGIWSAPSPASTSAASMCSITSALTCSTIWTTAPARARCSPRRSGKAISAPKPARASSPGRARTASASSNPATRPCCAR